jgi:hypothetical protein
MKSKEKQLFAPIQTSLDAKQCTVFNEDCQYGQINGDGGIR